MAEHDKRSYVGACFQPGQLGRNRAHGNQFGVRNARLRKFGGFTNVDEDDPTALKTPRGDVPAETSLGAAD
jgi:hypothetical protein